MLSQFVVIPPSNKSPEEVLSYVRPACKFGPIRIERRMVIRKKRQCNLAQETVPVSGLGARPASQKLGKNTNGIWCP
jgi:hypothetical protein